MSSNDGKDHSKTPTTTIKIAAKEASKRAAANGGADVGPGDVNAEPSMMPEPVTVPRPPTDSELVVKSVKASSSRRIKTINDPVSLPKSRKSSASTKLSSGSGGPPTEATSGKAINKTNSGSGPASAAKTGATTAASAASEPAGGTANEPSAASAAGGSKSAMPSDAGSRSKSAGGGGGLPEAPAGPLASRATFEGSERGVTESGSAVASSMGALKTAKTTSGPTGSQGASQAASQAADTQSGASGPGQEHDEEEEGEGEVEQQPSPGPEPMAGPSGASAATAASGPAAVAPVSPGVEGQPSGGIDTAPASSGGGASKMSPKTSGMSKKRTQHKTKSASSASSTSSHASSHKHGHAHGHDKKNKKKVTKFRYHKRITVRTHGKTSPSTIMHKVNEKDHKAGITPSTIEDMDTEELMRRAGIKGNKQSHWRVRLRQTKRITKGGKTVTQTKIAYRDSEGNKRVKTSLSPYCKKCGKKLEECKCEDK